MSAMKRVVIFFVSFLLVYMLLLVPWSGLDDSYNKAFCGINEFVMKILFGAGQVEFVPRQIETEMFNFDIILTNERAQKAKRVAYDSRYAGYLPMATLLALIVVTPVPWRRRSQALLWGLVLFTAFTLLRVFLLIFEGFSANDHVALFRLHPAFRAVVVFAAGILAKAPVPNFAAPVFIWALACFRKDDWQRAFQKIVADRAAGEPPTD